MENVVVSTHNCNQKPVKVSQAVKSLSIWQSYDVALRLPCATTPDILFLVRGSRSSACRVLYTSTTRTQHWGNLVMCDNRAYVFVLPIMVLRFEKRFGIQWPARGVSAEPSPHVLGNAFVASAKLKIPGVLNYSSENLSLLVDWEHSSHLLG